MTDMTGGADIHVRRKMRTFAQTDLATHELWAALSAASPAASTVLHLLVANVGDRNAVMMPQKLIAKKLGLSERTVRRALTTLADGNWLQVLRYGAGRECAYVLNSRVVWTEGRDKLRTAALSATLIVDAEDQNPTTLDGPPLHVLPSLYPGEVQLPAGDGLPPVSQPFLAGLTPDLPAALRGDPDDNPGVKPRRLRGGT